MSILKLTHYYIN